MKRRKLMSKSAWTPVDQSLPREMRCSCLPLTKNLGVSLYSVVKVETYTGIGGSRKAMKHSPTVLPALAKNQSRSFGCASPSQHQAKEWIRTAISVDSSLCHLAQDF